MTPETETPPPAADDTPKAAPPTASPERLKKFHELAAKAVPWDAPLDGTGEDGWDDENPPGDEPMMPVNNRPDDYIPPMPKLQYPPGSPERQRMLEELAAKSTATWESIDGVGKDWWTDEEFEEFLAFLRRSRRGEPL